MHPFVEKALEEFEEKFSIADFTWKENNLGEEFAKKSKRRIKSFLCSKLESAYKAGKEEAIKLKIEEISFKGEAFRRGYQAGCQELESFKEEIKKEIEKIAKWPAPQKGAGAGIGPLAGVGMYMQYDHDKKKHEKQVQDLLDYLNEK